jgi:hypothetical protein
VVYVCIRWQTDPDIGWHFMIGQEPDDLGASRVAWTLCWYGTHLISFIRIE